MRLSWAALVALVGLGSFSQATQAAEDAVFTYAPKLGFRFDGGLMKNFGTAGGTGGVAWGFNVVALYYPASAFAVGAGYRNTIDLIKDTTPVSEFFGVGRWYFLGQGTRTRTKANRMEMQRHQTFAFYTGLEIGKSSYYLGESAKRITDNLTGSYFNMNLILGAELRLSDHFEMNVEASQGLLVLASTDEKFRIRGTLLNIGLSYLW